jgi:hypothetical protein
MTVGPTGLVDFARDTRRTLVRTLLGHWGGGAGGRMRGAQVFTFALLECSRSPFSSVHVRPSRVFTFALLECSRSPFSSVHVRPSRVFTFALLECSRSSFSSVHIRPSQANRANRVTRG